MATVVFPVRIDSEVVRQVREAAMRSGIPQTRMIDLALRAYLGLESGHTLPDRVDSLERRIAALERDDGDGWVAPDVLLARIEFGPGMHVRNGDRFGADVHVSLDDGPMRVRIDNPRVLGPT